MTPCRWKGAGAGNSYVCACVRKRGGGAKEGLAHGTGVDAWTNMCLHYVEPIVRDADGRGLWGMGRVVRAGWN